MKHLRSTFMLIAALCITHYSITLHAATSSQNTGNDINGNDDEMTAYDLFKQGAYDDAALVFHRAYNEKLTATPKDNVDVAIAKYVTKEMMLFLEKGEFEKTPDYLKRISPANRNKKIRELADKEFARFVQQSKQNISAKDFQISRYNADSETFDLITSERQYTVHIPIKDAPSFKNNFSKMQLRDMLFTVENDALVLSGFTVTNPENAKTYAFRSNLPTNYNISGLEKSFSTNLGDFSPENAKNTSSNITTPATAQSTQKTAAESATKQKPSIAKPDDPVSQDTTLRNATMKKENGKLIIEN